MASTPSSDLQQEESDVTTVAAVVDAPAGTTDSSSMETMVRLMKQVSFTLELQKSVFAADPIDEEELRGFASHMADMMIPFASALPCSERSDFIGTIKSHIDHYCSANSQAQQYFYLCMKLRMLKLLIKMEDSTIATAFKRVYQEFDERPIPQIFELPSLNTETTTAAITAAATAAKPAIENITCLLYLQPVSQPATSTEPQQDEVGCGEDCKVDTSKSFCIESSSAFGGVHQLLQQMDVDFMDPDEILGCSSKALRRYFPILFTALENGIKNTEGNLWPDAPFLKHVHRAWNALIYRTHFDPYLSQIFYWLASINNLFSTPIHKSELRVFISSIEFHNAEVFLQDFNTGWEGLNVGQVFSPVRFLNPLSKKGQVVVKSKIMSVFSSKARPVLVKFKHEDNTKQLVIFKKGDDLRQDYYIQTLFKVFNELWESSQQLSVKPFIYTYRCVPLSDKFGVIECVPNVKSAMEFEWDKIRLNPDPDQKKTFICSLAGSYLASFVLGIRDRHEDNMLIKDEHIFFHIDFGHLWNNGPLLDAPRIAVPTKVKSVALNADEWALFETTLLEGFTVLHKYGHLIKNTAITLFKKIGDYEQIKEFIESDKSLMLNLPLNKAHEILKQSLAHSFTSIKKKLKKWGHKLAKEDVPRRDRSISMDNMPWNPALVSLANSSPSRPASTHGSPLLTPVSSSSKAPSSPALFNSTISTSTPALAHSGRLSGTPTKMPKDQARLSRAGTELIARKGRGDSAPAPFNAVGINSEIRKK